jgi:hypothetical protein
MARKPMKKGRWKVQEKRGGKDISWYRSFSIVQYNANIAKNTVINVNTRV